MASLFLLSGPRTPSTLGLLGRGMCGLVLAHGLAHAAGFDSWNKVEQAQETRDYGVQIREGKFDAAQKAFIEETLLPQLGLEANRATIGTVRQRIRDVALRGATKKEVVEQVNGVIRDGMLGIVAADNADALVQVNAMLLIGELQDADRAPWPGSLTPLVKSTADAALPLVVRVAALNGLAAHVVAAGGNDAATAAVAPAVAALVTSPPEGDPIAVRWLMSRALDLLRALPTEPAAIAAATRILANEKLEPDLRVRAAAVIGKLAGPQAGIDAAAAIAQIKSLARTVLSTDLDAAEKRRFATKMKASGGPAEPGRGPLAPPPSAMPEPSGGGVFGEAFEGASQPPEVVDEDAVSTLACRRNAWRLFVLAEAVRPARAGSGLAGLLQGEPAAAAADLAATLRQSAVDLDAKPNEESVAAALAALEQLAAAPGAAPPKAGGQPDPASPFDPPAGGSPF